MRSYVRAIAFVRSPRVQFTVMSDTPLGERPPTGGRVRQYPTDAHRARAWRERQREQRDEPGEPVPVMLAEATLRVLVGRLGEVAASHGSAMAELVGRVEEAIAALADPEAVADELAATRAGAARQA